MFRSRLIWLFLLLGLLNFLFHFALIYITTTFGAQLAENEDRRLARFIREFVFTGVGRGYREFLFSQGTVLMLLLAFGSSALVGRDFRRGALAFYLSKPITRFDYICGKWVAALVISSLITLLPALLLWLEYGAFTDVSYYADSARLAVNIVISGLLVSAMASLVVLALAAWLRRTALILPVWGLLFVLLPLVVSVITEVIRRDGPRAWGWRLLDFWSCLRWATAGIFGAGVEPLGERAVWASVVLLGWAAVAAWILYLRVRAVDVVESGP